MGGFDIGMKKGTANAVPLMILRLSFLMQNNILGFNTQT